MWTLECGYYAQRGAQMTPHVPPLGPMLFTYPIPVSPDEPHPYVLVPVWIAARLSELTNHCPGVLQRMFGLQTPNWLLTHTTPVPILPEEHPPCQV